MAKPPDAPKCREPGCGQPVVVNPVTGNPCLDCHAHAPPPKTLRHQIADGHCFVVCDGQHGPCGNCGGFNETRKEIDSATGLGPACHAIWRWSPIAEREFPR